MITRDLRQAAPRDSYRILTSLVLPRPIAWVGTLDPDGTVNLAPLLLPEAPVALECRLNREVALSEASTLVLLDVLVAHARDDIWNDAYDCADATRWEPVARLASVAGPNYAGLGARLTLGPSRLP